MWSALLAFPLSLLVGVAAGFLYKREWPDWLLGSLCLIPLAASAYFNQQYFLAFWLPGGLATVLLCLLASLKFLNSPDAISSTMQLELPSRPRLREVVLSAETTEQKRDLYLRLVGDYTKIWQARHLSFSEKNSRFLLYLFSGVFLVLFFVLGFEYQYGSMVKAYITEQASQIEKLAPKVAEQQDMQQMMRAMVPYYAAFIFIYCGFSALILLSMLRSIGRIRKVVVAPVGSLYLFKVPENSIWFFLASLGSVLLGLNINLPQLVSVISVNLLVILAFLYVLQGIGSWNLFLEVRLIPGRWFLIFLLLLSLLFPAILLTVVLLFFFLGALDFWFDFRKKALHPAFPSD